MFAQLFAMPIFQIYLSNGIKDPRAQEAIEQKTLYHLLHLTQLHTRSTSFKGRFSKVLKAERLFRVVYHIRLRSHDLLSLLTEVTCLQFASSICVNETSLVLQQFKVKGKIGRIS